MNLFEKEKFSGKYIITLEYKFNGLEKFEYINYLNEEILNLNNKNVTDSDIKLICKLLLTNRKYSKIKKIYLEENHITEQGLSYLLKSIIKFQKEMENDIFYIKKVDYNFMKIESLSLKHNLINYVDEGLITDLFTTCKYLKIINLLENKFCEKNPEKGEFINIL